MKNKGIWLMPNSKLNKNFLKPNTVKNLDQQIELKTNFFSASENLKLKMHQLQNQVTSHSKTIKYNLKQSKVGTICKTS